MNIFAVDDDPVVAAQSLGDRHVVKMVIELGQILSTVHRVIDGSPVRVISKKGRSKLLYKLSDVHHEKGLVLYSATHVNHPVTVWARENSSNYQWAYEHFVALANEYQHRYGKVHKTYRQLNEFISVPPSKLVASARTVFANCMPDEYIISGNPVVNYRNYYNQAKREMFVWTNRHAPGWILGYRTECTKTPANTKYKIFDKEHIAIEESI